jgi:hypothetical protein
MTDGSRPPTLGECRGRRAGSLVAALAVAGAELPAAALFAVLLAAPPAAGSVVTLTAVRDNTLFEDAAGSLSNGSGPAIFAGENSDGLIRRALVKFDAQGAIPEGALITNATITLNVSNVSDVTPRVFTLHRMKKDWGEGTSFGTGGAGAPATANDATWLCTFYPAAMWTQPGGDFEATAGATQLVGGVGTCSWSAPALAADVQAWRDGAVPDYGWCIVGDESGPGTARRFDSRENAVAANRPTLTVTYTLLAGVEDPRGVAGIVVEPCRPNPSTGAMCIRFALPARAHVELTVHDVLGRRVATVTDRTFAEGVHDVAWDGGPLHGPALGNGVYFIRTSVDGRFASVRRWVRVE